MNGKKYDCAKKQYKNRYCWNPQKPLAPFPSVREYLSNTPASKHQHGNSKYYGREYFHPSGKKGKICGAIIVASTATSRVSGMPRRGKSVNVYPPGPKTIKFVWYVIGVIKLQPAAAIMVKTNGYGLTSKPCAALITMGNMMTAAPKFVIS